MVLALTIIISACSSTSKVKRHQVVRESSFPSYSFKEFIPKGFRLGSAYTDSIHTAIKEGQLGFDIQGSLPDGCSQIWISYHQSSDSIFIEIKSIKEKDAVCSMGLVPFQTFVFANQFLNEPNTAIQRKTWILNHQKFSLH